MAKIKLCTCDVGSTLRPHRQSCPWYDSGCEHLSIVIYTIRDWRETGIAPGTVCEDCGREFDEDEIEDMDTRDFEEMVNEKADRQRERYQ